jgi:hypothetical protein
MISMCKLRASAICCAFLLSACDSVTATPVPLKVITTAQQGMHQWPAFGEKLVLIVGTSTDTTTYKQSITFYMALKSGVEWLHVPIKENKVNYTLTWMNISHGETTDADAIVAVHGKEIYLILAALDSKNGGIKSRTFKLTENGEEAVDEPGFMFKQVGENIYKQPNLRVEDVLKKEAQRIPTR